MLTRQRVILSIVSRVREGVSRLGLMRRAFLLSKDKAVEETGTFYQFLPLKRGPHSFTLEYELNGMVEDGILASDRFGHCELGDDVRMHERDMESALLDAIERLVNRYAGAGEETLAGEVRRLEPWYVSDGDERTGAEDHGYVYTSGYEALHVDGFLDLLLRSGIQRIVDVRSNPLSRRYGFHRSTLSRLAGQVGLEYRHVPELGIVSSWRKGLDGPDDYVRLFERYEREILPRQEERIDAVAAWMKEKPSVLVCQEADPHFCHRTCLAHKVSERVGLPVKDLRAPS